MYVVDFYEESAKLHTGVLTSEVYYSNCDFI